MGRPRKHDNAGLPVGMLRRPRGKRVFFYLQHRGGKQTPLGSDLAKAMDLYRTLNMPATGGWTAASKTYRDSKEFKDLSANTKDGHTRALDRLDAVFKTTPLEMIKPVTVGRMKREMADRPIAFNRMKAVMSSVWKLAREEGFTDTPFPSVKGYPENKDGAYVTNEGFWLLYEHAEQPLRDWMEISVTAGARVSDALRIRRKHVQAGKLEVWHSKRRKLVLVSMGPDLKGVIAKILKRPVAPLDAIIHDGKGQSVSYRQLRHLFNKARTACGGLEWTLKDIRAKAATDAKDLWAARALLGHQKPSTTARHYERRLRAKSGKLPAKKMEIAK